LNKVTVIYGLFICFLVDEETNGPWESNCNRVDYYQEAKECTYSPVVEEFAAKLALTNQVQCLPDGSEQLCKVVEVQRNTKVSSKRSNYHWI